MGQMERPEIIFLSRDDEPRHNTQEKQHDERIIWTILLSQVCGLAWGEARMDDINM